MSRHLATAALRDAAGRKPIVCPRCVSCNGSGVVAWLRPLEEDR